MNIQCSIHDTTIPITNTSKLVTLIFSSIYCTTHFESSCVSFIILLLIATIHSNIFLLHQLFYIHVILSANHSLNLHCKYFVSLVPFSFQLLKSKKTFQSKFPSRFLFFCSHHGNECAAIFSL